MFKFRDSKILFLSSNLKSVKEKKTLWFLSQTLIDKYKKLQANSILSFKELIKNEKPKYYLVRIILKFTRQFQHRKCLRCLELTQTISAWKHLNTKEKWISRE